MIKGDYSKILEKEDEFFKKFSEERNKQYPSHDITFRRIQLGDFERGFPDILNNLSTVGNVNKEDLVNRFKHLNLDKSDTYKIVVGVDNKTNKIIASGTLFFELKFIRNMGV